mmetsp:Transcript_27816/g.81631  ORF Transcript_27816/g.81631 Transcript_27816/m.81631 type:complete len:81 (-) Transcript_27816:176-418(-)
MVHLRLLRAAYAFDRDAEGGRGGGGGGMTWTEHAKIVASDRTLADDDDGWFGAGVAISRNTIFIGVLSDDAVGLLGGGSI